MNKKPVILFESYPDFSGSPLAIYNELVKRGYDKKYDLVWAVYSNFNEKTKYNTIKYFGCNSPKKQEIINRTKIIIDSNRYIQKLKNNVFRIHVRHGSCLKKSLNYCSKIGDVDAILTTSKEMKECDQKIWPESIKNKFIITGYPALDNIFNPKNIYDCGFMEEIAGKNNRYKKIIGWFPTYRQHRNSPNTGSKKIYPFGIPLINNLNDYDKLNKLLNKNNILLLIHPHHAQAKNYIQLSNKSNIKFIDEKIKLKYNLSNTDILGNIDALITDYSAAYHEYIILNKPIMLTVDDLLEYSKSCGFFVNYLEWIKGDYAIDINVLFDWINNISIEKDLSKKEREIALHKIHDYVDDKASQRVIEYMEKFFNL